MIQLIKVMTDKTLFHFSLELSQTGIKCRYQDCFEQTRRSIMYSSTSFWRSNWIYNYSYSSQHVRLLIAITLILFPLYPLLCSFLCRLESRLLYISVIFLAITLPLFLLFLFDGFIQFVLFCILIFIPDFLIDILLRLDTQSPPSILRYHELIFFKCIRKR